MQKKKKIVTILIFSIKISNLNNFKPDIYTFLLVPILKQQEKIILNSI